MHRATRCSITLAGSVLLAAPLSAQRTSNPPADAAPFPLHWLAGCWTQVSGARVVEEQWMRARGGAMLGMSRSVNNGRLTETELVILEQAGDSLHYRVRAGQHGECPRRVGVLHQQLVAVVVEVADERHADAQVIELAPDDRHRRRRRVVVDRDRGRARSRHGRAPRPGARSRRRSAVSVLVIDWTTTGWRRTDRDAGHVHGDRLAACHSRRMRSSADQPADVEHGDPDQEGHQAHPPGEVDVALQLGA